MWSLVICSQSSFFVTRAAKDDKGKTRFFFAKKVNSLLDKQLFFNVPFQSTKYKKTELYVDNKKRETIRDVYCPTCRTEKCGNISTNKTSSFYDCKKYKACCHVLNIPFKDQKPITVLFGGKGSYCFARKTTRDYKKRKIISLFEENSPPITIKHNRTWTKKRENHSFYGIIVSTPLWLIQSTKTSFTFLFYTLSVYNKASWFSESPTTVLSGLLTLDQIQSLWM